MSDIRQKHLNDISSNEAIRDAIRKIAHKGIVHSQTGIVKGTAKYAGFVTKIHTDESDPLYGTIDVQEIANYPVSDTDNPKLGLHEGVYLTAIQHDIEGYVIIPTELSDVVITCDPSTGREYVETYSHVDLIQLDSHKTISIGVREREQDNSDDDIDVHELELTGTQSNTTYQKDSITTQVKNDDNETTSTITADGMSVSHDKTALDITGDEATLTQGNSKVMVTDGVVYVGADSSTDDAVLGQQLASILSDLVGYLSQMMTPTMMGPQMPANVITSFITLKAKIEAFAQAHSGFLTNKVQIQK